MLFNLLKQFIFNILQLDARSKRHKIYLSLSSSARDITWLSPVSAASGKTGTLPGDWGERGEREASDDSDPIMNFARESKK